MKNMDSLKTAALGFNILGIFMGIALVIPVFIFGLSIFSISGFSGVIEESSSLRTLTIIFAVAIALCNFLIAWGLVNGKQWAWYLAAFEMSLFLFGGFNSIWNLELKGLITALIAVKVLFWLYKSYASHFANDDV